MVAIKGMKMPENCHDCPLSSCEEQYEHGYTTEIYDFYCMDRYCVRLPYDRRLPSCPLVEIEGE